MKKIFRNALLALVVIAVSGVSYTSSTMPIQASGNKLNARVEGDGSLIATSGLSFNVYMAHSGASFTGPVDIKVTKYTTMDANPVTIVKSSNPVQADGVSLLANITFQYLGYSSSGNQHGIYFVQFKPHGGSSDWAWSTPVIITVAQAATNKSFNSEVSSANILSTDGYRVKSKIMNSAGEWKNYNGKFEISSIYCKMDQITELPTNCDFTKVAFRDWYENGQAMESKKGTARIPAGKQEGFYIVQLRPQGVHDISYESISYGLSVMNSY